MDKINVLLTAIGGDIGYSIYKILKGQDFISNIICTDISDSNAGAKLCKNFEFISRADSKNYISDLEKLVEKYKNGGKWTRIVTRLEISLCLFYSRLKAGSDRKIKNRHDKCSAA